MRTIKTIKTKKNMLFILFALLTVSVSTNAQQLTEQQALQNANEFLVKRGRPNKISAKRSMRKAKAHNSQEAAYYVFNVGNDEGFVIASGDERTEKILGYADSGTLNEEYMPDNMKAWLQGYADQISNIPENYVASTASTDMNYPAIEPLIKTKWGQDAPYNAKCPEINGQKCVTGCVPTALAQLLNYHQYPKTLPALDAYSSNDALPGFDIDWNSIKNEYDPFESDDNVAWLMRYCGQAVHVNYGTSESGTFNIVFNKIDRSIEEVLREKFGFNKYVKSVYRGNYSIKDWNDLLISELQEKRPVYLSGNGTGNSGHAFICDGYDGNGRYHINWGWNGGCDGYFCIEILDPLTPGVTDKKDSGTYSNMLNATIGVTPQEATLYPSFVIDCYFGKQDIYNPVTVIHFGGNNEDLFPEGKQAIGLFDMNGNLVKRVGEINVSNSTFGMSISSIWGIEDGHYYLKALFQPSADEDWYDVSYDWNVIELIKDGSGITIIDDDSHRANKALDLSVKTKVIGEGKVNTKNSVEVVITNNGEEITGELHCDIMGKPNKPIQSYGGPSYDVVIGAGETMTFVFDDINNWCANFQEEGRYYYRLRWEEFSQRHTRGRISKNLCFESILVSDKNGQSLPICSNPVVQSGNGMIKGRSETENSEFVYLSNHEYYVKTGAKTGAIKGSLCCDEKIEVFMYAKAENHVPSDLICDSVTWNNAVFVVDSIVSSKGNNQGLPKCALPNLSIKDNCLVIECETEGATYQVDYCPINNRKSEITIPNNTSAPFFINVPMTARAHASSYESSDWVYGHLELSGLSFVNGKYAEITDAFDDEPDTDIATISNVVYVDNMEVNTGNDVVLSVNLKNSTMDVSAFSFNLVLPEGFTVQKVARGERVKTKDDDEEFIFAFQNADKSGKRYVQCYTMQDAVLSGKDGEVAKITISLPEGVKAGNYPIIIEHSEVAYSSTNEIHETVKSTLTVKEYIVGDANGDGVISITDVSTIGSYLLGGNPAGFNVNAADANKDGVVSVTDISTLASQLLGK